MNNELEWEVITDPERLFRLQKAGWEIELQTDVGNDKYCPWKKWDGSTWHTAYAYRALPPKPKMKHVKLLAYLGGATLQYIREDTSYYEGTNLIRQPHLDLIAEVQE